jgi:hypothetical protein
LYNFVAAVGDKDIARFHIVQFSDSRPQLTRGPIGIAIPRNGRNAFTQIFNELSGWGKWGFIGVQPDLNLHLRRVIALKGLQIVSNRHAHHGFRLPIPLGLPDRLFYTSAYRTSSRPLKA